MSAEHHRVPVVRVPEIRKHPNADTLGLVAIDGYQVVVKLGDFQVGDLAVYIHPDSVVPQTEPFRFLWEAYVEPDGTVPEKRRRITVRKFRKEWSEGLLIPTTSFGLSATRTAAGDSVFNIHDLATNKRRTFQVGDDVSELLGITHYNPPEPDEVHYGGGKTKSPFPKSAKGWFFFLLHKFLRVFGVDRYGATDGGTTRGPANNPPTYDVENFKNHSRVIEPGEMVRITEKIHGSNARFIFSKGKMYAGSRNQWKGETAKCVWRDVLAADSRIETWCKSHPGYTLYGEVTPTQKDRKGNEFHYGSPFPQFFVFDILTPENTWATNQDELLEDSGLQRVPELYRGPFDEQHARSLADGPTIANSIPELNISPGHIREGVVVRPLVERRAVGLGRVQLKIVSNAYLEAV